MKRLTRVLLVVIVLGVLALLFWPEKRYRAYQPNDAYLAQVASFTIPPMPGDWRWDSFAGDDGVKMRWGETGNRNAATATVIMVPGYTATMSMYGEHAGDIASRGYHVIGFDLRGQGGSERPRPSQPEKLIVDDFARYSNELADFILAQNLPADRPVIVMGMSFGGHVATRMAGDHPGVADGLLLLAPALEPKAGDMSFDEAKRLLVWGRRLGQSKRYLPGNTNWVPYSEDNLRVSGIEHCASDPNRLPLRDAVFTTDASQRVGGVTYNWGGAFYDSSIYVRADGYPEAIDIPISMIHAERDDFVVTDVNIEICDTRLPDCTSVPITGAGHCLLQETDDRLVQVYQALEDVVARASAGTP
jgi:lysophospholipase